jgi:hypothetical protein
MGGKRPDQYRIAPEETLATDYKTRPLVPQDAVRDDHDYSRTHESKDGPWEAGQPRKRGRRNRSSRRT